MIQGQRVIYKPVTKRRGVIQKTQHGTILAVYPHEDQVRIKCDGERIHRRVKTKHIEVINGV